MSCPVAYAYNLTVFYLRVVAQLASISKSEPSEVLPLRTLCSFMQILF